MGTRLPSLDTASGLEVRRGVRPRLVADELFWKPAHSVFLGVVRHEPPLGVGGHVEDRDDVPLPHAECGRPGLGARVR